jgi:hypothetical protein
MIFDIENHFESQILALCYELAMPDKPSRGAYNPGLWRILKDLLKIGLPKVSLLPLMTLLGTPL